MSFPPIPADQRIPVLSHIIQDHFRDPPLVMDLDMGRGSREQSLPVHDSKPIEAIAGGRNVDSESMARQIAHLDEKLGDAGAG